VRGFPVSFDSEYCEKCKISHRPNNRMCEALPPTDEMVKSIRSGASLYSFTLTPEGIPNMRYSIEIRLRAAGLSKAEIKEAVRREVLCPKCGKMFSARGIGSHFRKFCGKIREEGANVTRPPREGYECVRCKLHSGGWFEDNRGRKWWTDFKEGENCPLCDLDEMRLSGKITLWKSLVLSSAAEMPEELKGV
jgi:hypothetical protein